jgi:SAM-dependent methyltransferase
MSKAEVRYEFGQNWQNFVATALDADRITIARNSLRDLLGTDSLAGRRVLDIGCGSGLFSLGAAQLGADSLLGFDYDPNSVATSRALRDAHGVPEARWQIRQGSILEPAFLATLTPADVVYAWGVLHHTGRMWDAIRNAAGLVAPGGLFAIAIYNRVASSGAWARIKRAYCTAPRPVQAALETGYLACYAAGLLAMGRNPVRVFREYRQRRGMSVRYDARDWLGGYPYEYATAAEVFEFVRPLGFTLTRLITTNRTGCNEFVFRRDP